VNVLAGPASRPLHNYMLRAQEQCFGLPTVEPHQAVLPIAHVVPKAHVEDRIAQIEAIEVEPESVDDALALVHDEKHRRCVAPPLPRSMRFLSPSQLLPEAPSIQPAGVEPPHPLRFRLDRDAAVNTAVLVRPVGLGFPVARIGDVLLSFEPGWPVFHIVDTRQKDIPSLLPLVQFVEVSERRMLRLRLDERVVQRWGDMTEVVGDVTRPELLPGEEMHQRCIVENEGRDLAAGTFLGRPCLRGVVLAVSGRISGVDRRQRLLAVVAGPRSNQLQMGGAAEAQPSTCFPVEP
jgi:hypothetical protein